MFDPALQPACVRLRLAPMDLWTRYFALGGNLDATAVEAYVSGLRDVPDIDHDLIVHVVNELYLDEGANHPLAYYRS
jgi:hypothetical protein